MICHLPPVTGDWGTLKNDYILRASDFKILVLSYTFLILNVPFYNFFSNVIAWNGTHSSILVLFYRRLYWTFFLYNN